MRVVFAGTPAPALPALEALIASRHEVAAVVTRPQARAGRGRRNVTSPVAATAREHGIEVLAPHRAGDADFLQRLRELEPRCCPVVAYGALLPQSALDVPSDGWINLHFSVLPAWRGAAPVQHALLHGDQVTGATAFRIVRELDAGPVFGVVTETIRRTDTAGDLLERLSRSGAQLLVDTLDHIESGDVFAREQPAAGMTRAPKIEVADARVRWEEPAFAVDRRIRACTPTPGAWTTWGDVRLKLGPVDLAGPDAVLPPGRLDVGQHEVLVGTGTSAVHLGLVQPPGRKAMPAGDWARGARLDTDVTLGHGAS